MEFYTHQQSIQCNVRIGTVESPGAGDLPPSKSLVRLHLNTVANHHRVVVTHENPPTEHVVNLVPGERVQSALDVDRLAILKPWTWAATGELDRILTSELQRTHGRLRNFIESSKKPWGIRAVNIVAVVKVKHLCFESLLVSARTEMLMSMSFDDQIDNDEAKCIVCLEELISIGSDQCEIFFMPCSHRFHAPCIHKWLNISRFCPICRFEMPKY